MKKYTIIYFLMMQSIMIIGMGVYNTDMAQVKRMEIVRRIFKKRGSVERRDSAEMSIESSTQSDDEMSLDRSGSFARPIPKPIVQKKVSNYFISEHGCSPPKREFSLEKLLQEQEKKKEVL